MSAIFELLLMYPFKLSCEEVAPSSLVVFCLCILALCLIFANGIVYSCIVENDEFTRRIQQPLFRPNDVHFHNHNHRTLLARIGIVSVSLKAVGVAVIFGLKLTQKRWIIENILWRLLFCLISTTAILSEIPSFSKHLRWSDCVRQFIESGLNILTLLMFTGRFWSHTPGYGMCKASQRLLYLSRLAHAHHLW